MIRSVWTESSNKEIISVFYWKQPLFDVLQSWFFITLQFITFWSINWRDKISEISIILIGIISRNELFYTWFYMMYLKISFFFLYECDLHHTVVFITCSHLLIIHNCYYQKNSQKFSEKVQLSSLILVDVCFQAFWWERTHVEHPHAFEPCLIIPAEVLAAIYSHKNSKE